jgi:hypothetical protein
MLSEISKLFPKVSYDNTVVFLNTKWLCGNAHIIELIQFYYHDDLVERQYF